jgi:hypothetical protein
MHVVQRVYRTKSKGTRSTTYRYVEVRVSMTEQTKARVKARAKREEKTMAGLARNYIQRGLALVDPTF